jgi:hypothetical protein
VGLRGFGALGYYRKEKTRFYRRGLTEQVTEKCFSRQKNKQTLWSHGKCQSVLEGREESRVPGTKVSRPGT